MKKKILICTLLSAAALTASAVFAGCGLFGGNGDGDGDTYRQDNMSFELKEDGTYELARYEYANLRDGYDADDNFVAGYKGEGETVTVPDTVNGKAVTSVKGYAFSGTGVKEVTLPEVITVIPDRLFDGCELLETVNFSNATSVGDLAFINCINLKNIEFGTGLTSIGDRAFESCTSLATLSLPDTVKSIGENCFSGCPFGSLNTNGVETLADFAFYGCVNLTSLNLPKVVSIGDRAFDDCDNLSEMTIGNKLESCATRLNGLTKISINSPIPERLFNWDKKLTEVTLGEGVTSIGELAFGYCSELKNITLPATLKEIGKSAFWESGITSVIVPASVRSVGESAFYGCRALASLTIENGVESIGASAFEGTGITSLSLPASVKSVADKAFKDCNAITELSISEGLETIGNNAFAMLGDETLEIVLPSTVKSIGAGSFYYNWGSDKGIRAKKIVVNDTVETVGEDILKDCRVKELTVPASYGHNARDVETLTLFGEGDLPYEAYYYCTALKKVDLGGSVKRIGSRAFRALKEISLAGVEFMGDNALGDLSALTYTKSKNGVNFIDDWIISSNYTEAEKTEKLDLDDVKGVYEYAFRDVTELKELLLVENASKLQFIGRYAFGGTGIASVYIPSSLKNWGSAFANCKSLITVVVGEGVEEIPNYAFGSCDNLFELNLASAHSLKKIGDNAFYGCKSLIHVTLNGVEEVGSTAFQDCASLMDVDMNSVKKIGGAAFEGCNQLGEIELPASITEIGVSAFGTVNTVVYDGTKEQWEALTDGKRVYSGTAEFTVEFSDGTGETYPKIYG